MGITVLDAHIAHAARMRDLLASGKFSDFIITCGDDIHHVHKAIVCQQSDFFEHAEKFPGQKRKESEEGKVNLPEDEPAMIKLLVQFLYEGDYEPKIGASESLDAALKLYSEVPSTSTKYRFEFPHTCDIWCKEDRGRHLCPHHNCYFDYSSGCTNFRCDKCDKILQVDVSELLIHSKMYEIADKYGVQGLKNVSREKFSQLCTVNWDTEIFLEALKHALTTTPDTDTGLREILCHTIASHRKLLEKPEMEDILGQHMNFAFSVLKRQAGELERLTYS